MGVYPFVVPFPPASRARWPSTSTEPPRPTRATVEKVSREVAAALRLAGWPVPTRRRAARPAAPAACCRASAGDEHGARSSDASTRACRPGATGPRPGFLDPAGGTAADLCGLPQASPRRVRRRTAPLRRQRRRRRRRRPAHRGPRRDGGRRRCSAGCGSRRRRAIPTSDGGRAADWSSRPRRRLVGGRPRAGPRGLRPRRVRRRAALRRRRAGRYAPMFARLGWEDHGDCLVGRPTARVMRWPLHQMQRLADATKSFLGELLAPLRRPGARPGRLRRGRRRAGAGQRPGGGL